MFVFFMFISCVSDDVRVSDSDKVEIAKVECLLHVDRRLHLTPFIFLH